MTTARPHYIPELLPHGLVIDGWRIVKRLDTGGFGAVYLVEKEGVRAALKIAKHRAAASPRDAGRTEERLLRELICELRLTHANVVRVLAHGRWPDPLAGYVYLVMEFIDGDTLKAWAGRNAPTVREALRLFVKLADALSAGHRLGILHRDIKPANILVRRGNGEPVVLDYGAGDFPQADPLTETVLPPGTITHRSPEAVRFERLSENDSGARYEYQPTDDLYSLGVTCYEVLTGQAPFPYEPTPWGVKRLNMDIELRIPPAPHELNPRVPIALSQVVMRLLLKEATQRHASAEALRRDLASLDAPDAALDMPLRSPGAPQEQGAANVTPPSVEATPPTGESSRRVRRAAPLAAWVGLVALLALSAFLLTRSGGSPSPAPLPPAAMPGATGEPVSERTASPQREHPAVTTPTTPSRSSSDMLTPTSKKKASGTPDILRKCALTFGTAAWIQMGCAGVQARPAPADCPPEVVEVMENAGMLGNELTALIDIHQPVPVGMPKAWGGVYRAGAVISRVDSTDDNRIPSGTLLYGQLWMDEKTRQVWGRWTEAELNGQKVPVCVTLSSDGNYDWGEDSKPGAVHLPRTVPVTAVEEWP